ncbi:magnesium transporter CorA family protein [Dactylosporangium aurantiacum]|uniref:Magnesium transporter CorA family protein n=1 Tax=Dactylosporangium aurantiacum TaxID=35754 RepID=A0A9Q9IHH4_9ACTN|nr:magnesium transporter CorA family protein [Dactylosporangium aurantiacum]MDG6102469.1 magnesium transporter CorA family protein [Dactylosporangium aurantiacum]UWZ53248.1 magnesium transporter CorA family protein [Dactylosporangium aurantiacum]
MARTRLYRNGDLVAEDFPIDDISEHLAAEGTVVWLDLQSPTPQQYDQVQEEFGLHQLAIEDASSPRERPKLGHYRGHLFLSAYQASFDSGPGELTVCPVSAFITPRALVTVHGDGFDVDSVVRRWDATAELAPHGVAYLVHGLLDVVVDGHFDAVQELDDALEALEDKLFEETPQAVREVQQRSFRLRRGLSHLRKIVLPMREVVNGLTRAKLVDEEIAPYYQDLYDHVLRVTEWTESLRDFVATILESNLAVQGNRMNNIMKKVTSWAAIIAVPTAVTGYYGQNLPFPGFEHRSGFVTSAALIVVLSVTLYLTFKRKDWL